MENENISEMNRRQNGEIKESHGEMKRESGGIGNAGGIESGENGVKNAGRRIGARHQRNQPAAAWQRWRRWWRGGGQEKKI